MTVLNTSVPRGSSKRAIGMTTGSLIRKIGKRLRRAKSILGRNPILLMRRLRVMKRTWARERGDL